MTADEHIPRKRYAVKELSAEETYNREQYLEWEKKSQREMADREAANRAALMAREPTPEEQRRTKRREAVVKTPTHADIPPFKLTWEQKQALSGYGTHPNGTYSLALGRPTDLDEWLTKRGALKSGRQFYEQNMPPWVIEWGRSHGLNVREAVDYARGRIPKLPPLPEAFHESARPRPRPEPRYKHSWEAKSTGSRHLRDDWDYDSEGNLMGKDAIEDEPQDDERSHRGNPPSQVGPPVAAGGGAGGGGGSSSSSDKTPSSWACRAAVSRIYIRTQKFDG
jgi:hypothetical protein